MSFWMEPLKRCYHLIRSWNTAGDAWLRVDRCRFLRSSQRIWTITEKFRTISAQSNNSCNMRDDRDVAKFLCASSLFEVRDYNGGGFCEIIYTSRHGVQDALQITRLVVLQSHYVSSYIAMNKKGIILVSRTRWTKSYQFANRLHKLSLHERTIRRR